MGHIPGDVSIDNLTIVSPRTNSWNMAGNLLDATIVESIFTPGITADITVVDYDNYLGKLKLAGDELVNLSFSIPDGGPSASYQFHLNNVKDVNNEGSGKAKTYSLVCVSRETLYGQANRHQKAYNTQISEIVKDVSKKLNSSLPVKVEDTKGMRNLKIPDNTIFGIMGMLIKEAVSNTNKSSNFLFYMTKSAIHFKTMEQMIKDGVKKEYVYDMTMGSSIAKNLYTNILSLDVKQNMDAISRLRNGALTQRVAVFNSHTNEYVKADFKPNLGAFASLGAGELITSIFKNLFGQANQTYYRHINPNNKLKIDKSHVPDNIANKMLNMAQMQEMHMNLKILGDPSLEAGHVIGCKIPEIKADPNSSGLDPQISGNWLISKLEHHIDRADVKPRYTMNLECLKGNYQESV